MLLDLLFVATALQVAQQAPRPRTDIPLEISEPWEDEPAPPNPANCPVPRPRADQTFILLGFLEGSGVSSLAVTGLDEKTTTGTITLGAGPKDLFLVLTSSEPMIYRFDGQVDRLQNVVVLHGRGGGVVGVSATKVSFGTGFNCQIGWEADDAPVVVDGAEKIFGRRPDEADGVTSLPGWMIGARGGGTALSFPAPEPRSASTPIQDDFERYNPGGAVSIDPATLISSGTASRYDVLPELAGARQLELAGHIVLATDEELAAWKSKATARYGPEIAGSVRTYQAYRVVYPIKVPIGLCGAHSITFLVPAENYLSGNACHSDVIAEDGRILTERRQEQIRNRERKQKLEGQSSTR